jgi:IS5 family transposase
MRQHYDNQRRFDCTPVGELMLNYDCRDEVVPVLAGLQYVYTCGELRRKVVKLVAEDINEESRRDVGRPGLDDWQIVVLAAVRLGCNYDDDKLQDQAENHRALRTLLGLGEWDEGPSPTSTLIDVNP